MPGDCRAHTTPRMRPQRGAGAGAGGWRRPAAQKLSEVLCAAAPRGVTAGATVEESAWEGLPERTLSQLMLCLRNLCAADGGDGEFVQHTLRDRQAGGPAAPPTDTHARPPRIAAQAHAQH